MSNIYNIGRITYQEAVRQSLFYIVLAVSAVLLLISPLFCLFAFGELDYLDRRRNSRQIELRGQ